jgi:excisionase family DNA binding protein
MKRQTPDTIDNIGQLWTLKEVAQLFRVGHMTVIRLCADRQLAHYRIGGSSLGTGRARIPEWAIQEYIAAYSTFAPKLTRVTDKAA